MTEFETQVVAWMAALDERMATMEANFNLLVAAVAADREAAEAKRKARLTPLPLPRSAIGGSG